MDTGDSHPRGRLTEAEIEGWLGVEPGGRVELPSSALEQRVEVPPEPELLGIGCVFASLGGVICLGELHGMSGALAIGLFLLCVGLSLLLGDTLFTRVAGGHHQPRPLAALTLHGGGLIVGTGRDAYRLPWSDLADAAGQVRADGTVPLTVEGPGTCQLAFRQHSPLSCQVPPIRIRVTDQAELRAVEALVLVAEARRSGRLVPGDPDPPDLTVPQGALSPAEIDLPERDRGLSRAEQELDA